MEPLIPKYEAKASGVTKKDAKKQAVDDVAKAILKDGWAAMGFKDSNFLIKINEQYGQIMRTKASQPDSKEVDEEFEENKKRINKLCRKIYRILLKIFLKN